MEANTTTAGTITTTMIHITDHHHLMKHITDTVIAAIVNIINCHLLSTVLLAPGVKTRHQRNYHQHQYHCFECCLLG